MSSLYRLPVAAVIVVLLSSAPVSFQLPAQQHRINANRQYREYKDMLKAANMTAFPEGDIRNLVIDGHEFSLTTEHNAAKPNPNNLINSLFQTQTQITSTNTASMIKRSGSKMKGNSKKNGRRRQMGRHNRKKGNWPIGKPFKGETALSLNIAHLKQKCKTKPMKQRIKIKGCSSKSIVNNLCYGQCNSFYIPEVHGKGNGPPSFISCGFCRPKTVRPVYVNLRCRNRGGKRRWKRKKVLYVKKCRCMEQEIKVDKLS